MLLASSYRMAIVLVVDDSPVALRALGRRLVQAGFQVREEATASAARATDLEALACAVFDLELADGDGAELAEALRVKRPSLPVAFFTSGASAPVVERARLLGPILAKPDVDAVVAWASRVAQPPPTK
jgi:DNA-binding response OmpR family regulator